jgi:hypothetical protein
VQSTPPPLPRGLADPRPVIAVGTIAWFVAAAVVFLIVDPPDIDLLRACLTGGGLGLLGLAVMHWQRRAARRGSRGAQRGLL